MNIEKKKILQQAEALYDSIIVSENSLGNSDNMIFEMKTDKGLIILRVSDYSEEKISHTDFELNWLHVLSENMIEIARPLYSKKKNLYEIIYDDDKKYIVCAFEKAKGKLVDPNNADEWHEDLFENIGEIMGKIHHHSKKYLEGEDKRFSFTWDNDLFFQPAYDFIKDPEVSRIWNQTIETLHALPKSKASYGIIHNDLHHLNFFVDGKEIKVFDFDGCRCSWYFYDIVLTMYHMIFTLPQKEEKQLNQFAEKFILAFLKGYLKHMKLEKYWVDYFDLFLKYRRLCSYRFVMHLSRKSGDNKYKPYCDWLREEILKDQSIVSLDFNQIKSLFTVEEGI